MKALTICVYGDFSKKDLRLKTFSDNGTQQFAFQNILKNAGYDAELFFINDVNHPELFVDENDNSPT